MERYEVKSRRLGFGIGRFIYVDNPIDASMKIAEINLDGTLYAEPSPIDTSVFKFKTR